MSAFPLNFCPMCGESVSKREFDGRERAYCERCAEHIFRIPFPSAGVAVVDGDRICLLKRATDPHRGTRAIPGGVVEYDEGPREAATRELAEETGIDAPAADCHPVTAQNFGLIGDIGSFEVVYAVSRANTTGAIDAGDEAEAVRFWRLDEFATTDEELRPGEEALIRQAVGQGDLEE